MWVVRMGQVKARKQSRAECKDYVRDFVQEANVWEVAAGQKKSEVGFQDMPKQTIIYINGKEIGHIYEIPEN